MFVTGVDQRQWFQFISFPLEPLVCGGLPRLPVQKPRRGFLVEAQNGQF
jgi:hypothetical protein